MVNNENDNQNCVNVECNDQARCNESLWPVTMLIFVMLWQEPSDMYLKSLIKRQLFFSHGIQLLRNLIRFWKSDKPLEI